MPIDGKDNSAEGVVKQGTSTVRRFPPSPLSLWVPLSSLLASWLTFFLLASQVGNAFGGLTKTVGGVVGTAGRGVGETFNQTTGTKQAGDALQGLTDGVENGANSVGKGVEDAGQGKKSSW